jgi:protein O-mannosyl-transferase
VSKPRAKPPKQPQKLRALSQKQSAQHEEPRPAAGAPGRSHLGIRDGTRLDLLIYLALLLATFAVYVQVRHFDFVNYDDRDYTTGNVHVRDGLTMQGLEWALTSRDAANWFPVTWVSHMLDAQFFGLESGWDHLHNVLLHALAAILLCIFLERATGARWRSALVALLFALHPLHVESVAWVAERKDVLSGCFWFLTLWAYVRYAERPSWTRYLAVASGLCLGLMAKPMVVTLPLVLLLLDYWPLARLRRQGRKVIWEKLPLLGLSVIAAIITYLVQQRAGAVKAVPPATRLANATLSYALYIQKTFWPSRLAVFYPYSRNFPFIPLFAAGLLLFAVTAGVILLRRVAPYLLAGWAWFVITLVPVIGLVQAGGQARADRYMYIPMVGLLIMTVWGAAGILENWRPALLLAVPLAAAACLACAALTWMQVGYWRNSETLFRHALEVTDDNSLANHSLGNYLMTSGRVSEAMPYLEAAAQLDPDSPPAHTDLGSALAKSGQLNQAIEQFQQAIRLAPEAPIPHNNLGSVFMQVGRTSDAIAEFQIASRLDPGYDEARRNLAAAQGSGSTDSHLSRGIALLKAGDSSGAVTELETAVRSNPNDADAENNLGVALSSFPSRQRESIAAFEAAVRLKPDSADAQYNLGVALSGIPGRLPQALKHLEEAERLKPDPQLEQAIAQLRAAHR